MLCLHQQQGVFVIPAQVGIQCLNLDSRLRGNDGTPKSSFDKAFSDLMLNHDSEFAGVLRRPPAEHAVLFDFLASTG